MPLSKICGVISVPEWQVCVTHVYFMPSQTICFLVPCLIQIIRHSDSGGIRCHYNPNGPCDFVLGFLCRTWSSEIIHSFDSNLLSVYSGLGTGQEPVVTEVCNRLSLSTELSSGRQVNNAADKGYGRVRIDVWWHPGGERIWSKNALKSWSI